MGEREMVDKLLEFDPLKVRRDEAIVSWKLIAAELGVSEDSVQRRCRELGIKLPRWGPRPTSPVFLPRGRIVILRTLYFA